MATIFFVSAPIYPFIREEEESDISTAIAIGGTTLVIDNTQGFNANDYIVLGTIGTEAAEIVQIATVDSNIQLTIGATKFSHAVNDKLRRTPFDKVKFYQSDSADGSYTIDGSAEDMQVDNVDENTGHSTTLSSGRDKYWKATYFNSTNSDETDLEDSEAVLGATVLYCNPQDVTSFLDVNEDSLDQSAISLAIEHVTTEIEDKTNRVFYKKTVTLEYQDGKSNFDDEYFLQQTRVVSITSIETTSTTEGSASPTFNTLTNVTDYERQLDIGLIAIVNSGKLPAEGRNRFRATYITGSVIVPRAIRDVAIFMVIRDLAKAEAYSELIKSSENIKEKIADINEDFIMKKLKKYIVYSMGNT